MRVAVEMCVIEACVQMACSSVRWQRTGSQSRPTEYIYFYTKRSFYEESHLCPLLLRICGCGCDANLDARTNG
jgi:hypothetical protein